MVVFLSQTPINIGPYKMKWVVQIVQKYNLVPHPHAIENGRVNAKHEFWEL